MALLDKVRRLLHTRYTPFFLPVVASLAYIGIVILAVPEDFSASAEDSENGTADSDSAAPANSAVSTEDAALKAAKRRARLANRAAKKASSTGAIPGTPPSPDPASMAPPAVPPSGE